jgi:uncharacterized protein YjbI with pentapeptide repeats
MDPMVQSALISATATVVSVGGTVVVAIVGFGYSRSTNRETIKAAKATNDETVRAARETNQATIDRAKAINDETVRAARETNQATIDAARDDLRLTLDVTRDGQIADRYTKAIEQLGSTTVDVTIGGIYALERIARDSPERDHPTVMEVLAACIREHSREQWPPTPSNEPGAELPERTTRPDIQAALTVIGRRDTTHDQQPIDLTDANLTRANLTGARLSGARLSGADLTRADLRGADLTRASLSGANLTDADLRGADLTRANLSHADLTRARLTPRDIAGESFEEGIRDDTFMIIADANLYDASRRSANLADAILYRANLTGADLIYADLIGAKLQNADLTRAELIATFLVNPLRPDTDLNSEEFAARRRPHVNLTDADLTRANLTDANLYGANLYRANLTDARLTEPYLAPEGWACVVKGVSGTDR